MSTLFSWIHFYEFSENNFLLSTSIENHLPVKELRVKLIFVWWNLVTTPTEKKPKVMKYIIQLLISPLRIPGVYWLSNCLSTNLLAGAVEHNDCFSAEG